MTGQSGKRGRDETCGSTELMELLSASYFLANEAPLQEGGAGTKRHCGSVVIPGTGANEVPEARNSLGSSDSAPGRCYFHSPKDLTKEGKSPVKTMCVGGRNLEWGQGHGEGPHTAEDPGWIQGLGGRSQETRLKGWKEVRVCRVVGPGLRGRARHTLLGGGTAHSLQTHSDTRRSP